MSQTEPTILEECPYGCASGVVLCWFEGKAQFKCEVCGELMVR